MRAAVRCAIVVVALGLVGAGRAGGVPLPKFGEPSCEEQCRIDGERASASCDISQSEGDRALCRETARARRDVCLRVCDD